MLKIIFIFSFLFLGSFSVNHALATVTQDDINGTYTNDFSTDAGMVSKSNVNINTVSSTLQLTNVGGTFTPPYNATGYAITNTIIPQRIGRYESVTVQFSAPTSTSILIQVLDETNRIYPDSIFSGNSTGFSTTTINLSSLPLDPPQPGDSYPKQPRIRFKITLTTVDTNVSPVVDNLSFSWLLYVGDVSPSSIATSSMPTTSGNKFLNKIISTTIENPYFTPKWEKTFSNGMYPGFMVDDSILFKTISAIGNVSYFASINKLTGDYIWDRSLINYSDQAFSLSANGTLYSPDYTNDVLWAYDANNGSVKWSYQFNNGHGDDHVAIDTNGTIYTVHNNGNSDHYLKVYALNSDGSVKWEKLVDPDVGGPYFYASSPIAIDGDLIIISGVSRDVNYIAQDHGFIYAFNKLTGDIEWSKTLGDNCIGSIIGGDGTIYYPIGGCPISGNPRNGIYAFNVDGSEKWFSAISTSTTNIISGMVLKNDGKLLVTRIKTGVNEASQDGYIEEVDTADGNILQSVQNRYLANLGFYWYPIVADLEGNFIVSEDAFISQSYDTSQSGFSFYDKNLQKKFQYLDQDSAYVNQAVIDETGMVFVAKSITTVPNFDGTIYALSPWALSASSINTREGDAFSITARSSMSPTNLLTGETNKVQAIVDGNTIPLAYTGTDSEGNYLWSASPDPSLFTSGNYIMTVEASQANTQTDIATNFSSPATLSNDTGLIATSTFIVTVRGSEGGGPVSTETKSVSYEAPIPTSETATSTATTTSLSPNGVLIQQVYDLQIQLIALLMQLLERLRGMIGN